MILLFFTWVISFFIYFLGVPLLSLKLLFVDGDHAIHYYTLAIVTYVVPFAFLVAAFIFQTKKMIKKARLMALVPSALGLVAIVVQVFLSPNFFNVQT